MGYVPADSEWFVAELVMEITVEGEQKNVVHRNLTLIRASDAETAFERAKYWGNRCVISYENRDGRKVEFKFRGISKLDVIIDPLEDGSELCWDEFVDVSSEEIDRWVCSKEQLQAFKPPRRDFHPDYGSKAIWDKLASLAQDEDEQG